MLLNDYGRTILAPDSHIPQGCQGTCPTLC
jgi:hypothetical protein